MIKYLREHVGLVQTTTHETSQYLQLLLQQKWKLLIKNLIILCSPINLFKHNNCHHSHCSLRLLKRSQMPNWAPLAVAVQHQHVRPKQTGVSATLPLRLCPDAPCPLYLHCSRQHRGTKLPFSGPCQARRCTYRVLFASVSDPMVQRGVDSHELTRTLCQTEKDQSH